MLLLQLLVLQDKCVKFFLSRLDVVLYSESLQKCAQDDSSKLVLLRDSDLLPEDNCDNVCIRLTCRRAIGLCETRCCQDKCGNFGDNLHAFCKFLFLSLIQVDSQSSVAYLIGS